MFGLSWGVLTSLSSGHARPRHRGIFFAEFFEFSPVDVFLDLQVVFVFFGEWPQNLEKLARLPGVKRTQNPVTSLAVMVALVPMSWLPQIISFLPQELCLQ